jgi:hypothetical protein
MQCIRGHTREADQDPRVFQIMIGDVVCLRINGQQIVAFLEGGAYNQRVSVFAQPRQQLAAGFKCRCAVRSAFLYVRERQRDFADVFESDRSVYSCVSMAGFDGPK